MSNPHPTPSFKPGNKAALGNDKTMRLSTWIEKALDKEMPDTLEGYEKGKTARQFLAEQILSQAMTLADPKVKLDYIKEIADRTEGKPSQNLIHSGDEDHPLVTSVFFKPEKRAD